MPYLPTFPDRLWYAYHCLPRDAGGELPSYRALERDHGLSSGLISRLMRGERPAIEHETWKKLHVAFRVPPPWLDYGGQNGPPPPRVAVPLRPGIAGVRYGDLPEWESIVAMVSAPGGLAEQQEPPVTGEEFLAGAEMVVARPTEQLTPALVVAAARYAWETAAFDDRARYTSTDAKREADRGKRARTARAAR